VSFYIILSLKSTRPRLVILQPRSCSKVSERMILPYTAAVFERNIQPERGDFAFGSRAAAVCESDCEHQLLPYRIGMLIKVQFHAVVIRLTRHNKALPGQLPVT